MRAASSSCDGDSREVLPEQDDAENIREARHDERSVGVDPAERCDERVRGDDRDEGGYQQRGEQDEEDHVLEREPQARERVGGERIQHQVPGDDPRRHDEAVQVVLRERRRLHTR